MPEFTRTATASVAEIPILLGSALGILLTPRPKDPKGFGKCEVSAGTAEASRMCFPCFGSGSINAAARSQWSTRPTFAPMNIRLLLPLLCLLCSAAGSARADGKMYWRENVPPSIPYQRAVIFFQDGVETLVLQSKYQMPGPGEAAPIGWVVPVPAVPELASLPADVAHYAFFQLDRSCLPHLIRISRVLCTCFVVLCLMALLYPPFMRRLPGGSRHPGLVRFFALLGFAGSIVLPPAFAPLGTVSPVDILSAQRVGIYDVQVIRGAGAEPVMEWLRGNAFEFGDDDRAAFASYVSRGWCFVVAKINPEEEDGESRIAVEGLAAPLIMRFPHSAPVYPLMLTGAGGFDTEVLVYLASDRKWTCGERLDTWYAGKKTKTPWRDLMMSRTEPPAFAERMPKEDYSYITKFKGTLTPTEMAEDLVFSPAADDQPFQKTVWAW